MGEEEGGEEREEGIRLERRDPSDFRPGSGRDGWWLKFNPGWDIRGCVKAVRTAWGSGEGRMIRVHSAVGEREEREAEKEAGI